MAKKIKLPLLPQANQLYVFNVDALCAKYLRIIDLSVHLVAMWWMQSGHVAVSFGRSFHPVSAQILGERRVLSVE